MKRLLTTLLLLTASALCFAQAETDVQLFNEIKQSFDNGFYPGAVTAADKLQSSYPESSFFHSALAYKGQALIYMENYDEAISLYQEAISINPKKIECYLNLAKCHLEKKDYIKSIELCKYVCENTEDLSWKATAFGILGYSFRAQNKLDEALKAFEYSQMLNSDPIIKEAYIETKELKEKQEAEAYINPEIAEIENLKANELYRTGKFSEALKVYEEAIKRNPKLPKYYTNRAQCKIKLMEYDQAIKDCETAIKIEPKTIKAYQKKANCHFITKEYDKVLKTIDDGMKFFPNDEVLREMKEKTILILTMN